MRLLFFIFIVCNTSYSSSVLDSQANRTMTRNEYAISGLVGSLVGFGSGHSMQGRQLEGEKFTMGAVGSMLVMMAATQDCNDRRIAIENCSGQRTGLGAFFAFRLWEIADLWYGGWKKREKQKTNLSIPYLKHPRWALVLKKLLLTGRNKIQHPCLAARGAK